jgi:RNA polymerase sigma-70 factor (ECF subfamily)
MVETSHPGLILSMDAMQYASESELVAGCRRRDLAAIEQLYLIHSPRLKSVGLHMVGNRQDAEDAVQETFIKAYRGIGGFQGQCGIGTWLCRILINICYDVIRQRRREVDPEQVHVDNRPGPGREFALKAAIECALKRIHWNHRRVFVLFEIEGLRHSEIAAILEVPEGTCRAWLVEAKKELKRLLTETPQ